MDLIQRRRAIYTGMRAYFDDHELYEAITLWQKDYADKPKYALSVFVARCCSRPELKTQRSKILGAIFDAMDLPDAALLPDPFDGNKGAVKLPAKTEHVQDSKTRIFVQMFEQIVLKVNEKNEQDIRQFLLANMHLIETDVRRMMHLKQWLTKQSLDLAANYNTQILQSLIHLCYRALCEIIGPVKADQIFAQATKQTEPLAISLHFKLHDLL